MARSTGRSERDTCRDIVLPALTASGWAPDQIRPEYRVTAERVLTSGGISKDLGDGRVDYVLEAVAGQVPDSSTGRLRLTEYGEHVKGVVRSMASSAGDFTARWARSPGRDEIVDQLASRGIALADLPSDRDAPSDVDPLDVLLQVAWNVPTRTRAERARRVREAHAAEIRELSAVAQQVLGTLLDRYAVHGIGDVTSDEVLSVPPIRNVGSPVEIAKEFGGARGWHDQLDRLQTWLYSA